MQNRIDALFEQIACDSEYFDRDAAVFIAKHQRKSVSRCECANDVCINTFLLCGCMKINSVQNLRTK